MALDLTAAYPGKIDPADGEYPKGRARNVTASGDGTGTPYDYLILNDIIGFLQKLVTDGGVTISGNPDTVLASDYFDGLFNIIYKGRVVIKTQTEFDSYFDGAGTKTGNIYLISGTIYQVNNDIIYGSNFKLDGDPGVLIERAGPYRCLSAGSAPSIQSGIYLSPNLTFDGKKATYTLAGNGGFADVSYTKNCRFEMNVINCKAAGDGGAYYATIDTTQNNTIKNVLSCEAVNGGGVFGVYGSEIINISDCVGAGAVQNCNMSTIHTVFENNNTGVTSSANCVILNSYNNTNNGVNDCDGSTISSIYGNGNNGVTSCDNSTIDNVHDNATIGVNTCAGSTISNVYANGTDGVAGCMVSAIDNVHNNSNNGVNGCDSSSISNIYLNGNNGVTASGQCTIDNVHTNVIGVNVCPESTISSVYDNTGDGVNGCINCTIDNIHNNSNNGVNGCSYSTISNVYLNGNNGVTVSEDSTINNVHNNVTGVNTCTESTITNIYDNTGIGVTICSKCMVTNIHGNSLAGVSSSNNCTISDIYANGGAGVDTCNNCVISNVYDHLTDPVGTGVTTCSDCTISNIHDNNGGCRNVTRSTITDVYDNTETTLASAGGCQNCDSCSFFGNFSGNVGTQGTYDELYQCDNGIAFIIGTGLTEYLISTARGLIQL